jgi:hypothetical protein
MGSNLQLALGRTYALKNNNKWGFAGAFIIRNEQNKLDIDHTGRGNWLDTTGKLLMPTGKCLFII